MDEQLVEKPAEEQEMVLLHETEEGKAIVDLVLDLERMEEYVRYRSVLKWRKHMLYWDGIQYLVENWNERSWLTPSEIVERNPEADIDPALYAKVVNVYKAHGEIYIGALTSGTPTVRFFPHDADDPEDIATAKGASIVADLVQRQNKARMFLMKSMFLLYNQGLVAAYNDQKEDRRFGQIEVPDYGDVTVVDREHYCPSCASPMGQEQWTPPTNEDAHPMEKMGPVMSMQACPNCGQDVEPQYDDHERVENQQIGSHKENKNRECLEAYGPLNVKLPMWVREQAATPYIELETEESTAIMREIYPELADKITDISYPDNLDREQRVPHHYRNDFPKGICTVKRIWLRQWAFNYILQSNKEMCDQLKAKYKDGCYAVIINGSLLAETLPDPLDDHWTLTENPLSETVHAEPIGAPMMHLQDMTNELTNLTLETIEFGIAEVFADTRFLDFDSYPNQEARPGQISPASVPSGMNMSQGFFSVKPASLSREVELFADRLTTVSQFVMGTFPSVFGGAQSGGGDTAREYELSKASALQRISSTWTMLQDWYAKVIGKATRSYIKNMREDEHFVKSKGNSYINVWIRREELTGEIGEVEPEVSETFPMSWAQKREVMLQLIGMKDENITAVITHPENAGMVASLIGIPELYIPGDDDRSKQIFEIAQLIQGEPVQGDMGQMMSTVPVTPDLDNHPIEIEICGGWLKSAVGLDAKTNNPGGYANVLTHRRDHQMAMSMQMSAAPPAGFDAHTGGKGGGKPTDISGPPADNLESGDEHETQPAA